MVGAVPRETISDMNLILEVVACDGQTPSGEPRKVFGVEGGRIGRASDCDWVLRSPYISRYHATICSIDGGFHIVSTSENGVAINDAHTILPQLEHRALKDGDRLFIDEYEITVAIPAAAPAAVLPAPEAVQEPISLEEDLTREAPLLRTAFGLDPLRNFTPTPPPATNTAPEAAWNHSPGLADHFMPPPVAPVHVALPADWDATHLPTPAPTQLPTPQPTVRAPPREAVSADPIADSSGAFDLSGFLRGAGIDPGSLAPEMAGTLGRMLRSVVQGLIEVLQTRAEFRDQFRLPVTRVKKSENNPLKFAIDADDALSSLLRKQADRYLGPLEAVEDAFDDIRTHHLAMVAGMHAGFESLLSRFDPKTLAPEFDKRARGGALWPMPAGMRYWRQYVDLFESLTGETQATFRRLFGEEFAQSYERHLDTAKRQRR
jgi:type VI secretion system protein ImpI